MKLLVDVPVRVPVRRVMVLLGLAFGAMSTVIVASSAWASAGCLNEQFRTGVGASLPDCRAYEQVSPQDKNGGSVDGGVVIGTEAAPEQTTLDGEQVTYASQTAFNTGGPQAAPASSQYMTIRSSNGWTTSAIDPLQDLPFGKISISSGNLSQSLFQGFTEDLRYGFLDAYNPQPVAEAPEGHYNPYVRENFQGTYTLLAGVAPPTTAVEQPSLSFGGAIASLYAGMSSDGKHVIFMANGALTPEAAGGKKVNLYEWNEGALELVNVLPNGKVDEGGAIADTPSKLRFGGRIKGEQAEAGISNFSHAISSDGRRVFWTGSNGRLYMHELTASGGKTVEVSASQKTGATPETGEYAHYWTASANGELVYFTSCEQLTNDSTAVTQRTEGGECLDGRTGEYFPNRSLGQDLYQYNTNTGKLTDITVDPYPGKSAYVQGVLGTSEDGSYVYFAARGALTEGAVETSNEHASEPENTFDIYVWHNGRTSLVVALKEEPGTEQLFSGQQANAWSIGPITRTSRVSPNGLYLAFDSAMPLTAAGITTPFTPYGCEHGLGGENFEKGGSRRFEWMTEFGKRCAQVFEYDAASEKLVCASCDPSGSPPTGNSVVPGTINTLSSSPGWSSSTRQQRYLADSGRLFFNSTAALVARDTNDEEDVYEYEPAGIGGCTGSSACLSLLSGGTSNVPSQFLDADAEGNNVFFATHDKLVSSDGDQEGDLYDARVNGGLASQNAENIPPCSGEACKSVASSAPSIYGAPASQAFVGAGNIQTVVQPSGPVKKAKKQPAKIKKRHTRRKGQRGKKANRGAAHGSRVRHSDRRGK